MCSWSSSVATRFSVHKSRNASFCHPWELDAASRLRSFASGFPVLDQSVRQGALSIPGLFDQCNRTVYNRRTCRDREGHPSRPRFGAAGQAEILRAAQRAEMADVKQMKKIVPLIACEISFCQYLCKLVFGVDILDLILVVQINSVKQPIKSNSVGSGYMSHSWTSAIDDHFDHDFVILKDVRHRTKSRKLRVRRHTVNIVQIKIVVLGWNLGFVLGVLVWCGITRQVSVYLTFGVVELVWCTLKHFSNQIQKIKSWNSIHA